MSLMIIDALTQLFVRDFDTYSITCSIKTLAVGPHKNRGTR